MKILNRLLFILLLLFSIPAFAKVVETATYGEYKVLETNKQSAPKPNQPEESFLATKINSTVKVISNKWSDFKSSLGSFFGGSEMPSFSDIKDPEKIHTENKSLPNYRKVDKETAQSQIKTIKEMEAQILKHQPLQVESQSSTPTSSVKKNADGVPVIPVGKMIRVKNIGTEPRISKNSLILNSLKLISLNYEEPKPLASIKVYSDESVKKRIDHKLLDPTKMESVKQFTDSIATQPISANDIAKVEWPPSDSHKEPSPLPYADLSENEIELLLALYLKEKKNLCEHAIGRLHALSMEKDVATAALFHKAECAYKLGLVEEGFHAIYKILESKDVYWTPKALEIAVRNLITPERPTLARHLKNIPAHLYPSSARSKVYLLLAKEAYIDGKNTLAISYAKNVSVKSKHHKEAQFVQASSLARLDKHAEAHSIFRSLIPKLDPNEDKHIFALTHINVARNLYRNNNYKQAIQYLNKIPKNHPTWLQAMIEMGWTQLMLDDSAGAIGNMYSLHSPYFKLVFKPESYAIRAIGYLNICQYGDAYRTITGLEKEHRPWLENIKSYISNHKSDINYYVTILNYLKGSSDQTVDGLPAQVLREVARQPSFLNLQKAVNLTVDEEDVYKKIRTKINGTIASLNARKTKVEQRVSGLKQQIQKASADAELKKNLRQLNARLNYETNLSKSLQSTVIIYEESKKYGNEFEKHALPRLMQARNSIKNLAGQNIKSHFKELQTDINRILENNEFLRYEVFSGSGENIRFQAAGGKVDSKNRIPAHIKPKKILKWEFDGEYWEDEIGAYRSSLQNNCPDTGRAVSRVDN